MVSAREHTSTPEGRTRGDTMTTAKKPKTGPALSDEDTKLLRAFNKALKPFEELRHDMPLQYVRTFMLVATEPGLGVTEYANKAGVTQTVMSRHLLDIGERNRHMEPGFGLVEKRYTLNLRQSEILLTEKGIDVARKMARALKGV